jgi:hypothetical protein
MTTREVMQQALDALEEYSPLPADGEWYKRHHAAIRTLREALAQPAPQPAQGEKQ